jgi:hypothetical protein
MVNRRFSYHVVALAILASFAGCLAAQAPSAAMRGSITGFIFDPAVHGLRPILGMPGASTLGDPMGTGVALDQAAVSFNGDYALAVSDTRALVLIRQLSGASSIKPLGADAQPVDSIQLSPLGRAALLFRRDAATLQVVTGLPDAPVFGPLLELSPLGGAATAMAVNDSGVVAVAIGKDPSRIWIFNEAGQFHLVSRIGHVSAITFVRGSDAIVADDIDHKVYMLPSVNALSFTLVLAGESAGIKGPVALIASKDQTRVYVLNSGSSDIVAINLSDESTTRYTCPCTPTALARLGGTAVFRLTEPSDGPMWLFDGDLPEPRIVFVPARKDAAKQ